MSENQRARERITRERVQLLVHYPFFGYLALGLELKEAPEVGTMATDGKRLFYNPAFVDRLDPKVLRAIIAHETLHCALGHLWRKEARKQEKWNRAADHAANLILKKGGFALPENCLCDDKFEGMEAEIIYAKLPDSPSSKERLLDSHDTWSQGNNKNQPQMPPPPRDSSDQTPKDEQEKPRGSDDQKEGQAPKTAGGSDDENREGNDLKKLWQERLVRAATAARMQGKLPGTVDQRIQDILQPKLNWRIILRDMITSFAKNNFRLVPPSKKHLWRGIYLPSMTGETLEIAIGLDTSGSVSEKEFQEFLAEVKGVAEQFDDHVLHFFFCDAAIHERVTLTPHDAWPEQFSKRNGGTSFVPVFDAIADDNLPVSALVYLTDGAGDYPKQPPEYPVIWILNTDYDVPWGQKIKMEAENGSN